MYVNQQALLAAEPIKHMLTFKAEHHGTSYGLSELGYDIRIKQDVIFRRGRVSTANGLVYMMCNIVDEKIEQGNFALASAMEEFDMPSHLGAVVHDKSTWARRGLSVFNTVIEPGWKGFLTLELVYHGHEGLVIPAGSGIAQVLFTRCDVPVQYRGKYQNQENRPVAARDA